MATQLKSEHPSTIDHFITEEEQFRINYALSKARWRYDWPVNSTPFSRPCWHFFIAGTNRELGGCCEAELAAHANWGFLADIWTRASSRHMPHTKLVGVYANGQTSGQDAPIHRDNLASEPGKTLVIFCNDYWAVNWGGELIFFNETKSDIIAAVIPRPGRIVVFDGQIPHRAKSPSIECDQLRVTIAFKTISEGHHND